MSAQKPATLPIQLASSLKEIAQEAEQFKNEASALSSIILSIEAALTEFEGLSKFVRWTPYPDSQTLKLGLKLQRIGQEMRLLYLVSASVSTSDAWSILRDADVKTKLVALQSIPAFLDAMRADIRSRHENIRRAIDSFNLTTRVTEGA